MTDFKTDDRFCLIAGPGATGKIDSFDDGNPNDGAFQRHPKSEKVEEYTQDIYCAYFSHPDFGTFQEKLLDPEGFFARWRTPEKENDPKAADMLSLLDNVENPEKLVIRLPANPLSTLPWLQGIFKFGITVESESYGETANHKIRMEFDRYNLPPYLTGQLELYHGDMESRFADNATIGPKYLYKTGYFNLYDLREQQIEREASEDGAVDAQPPDQGSTEAAKKPITFTVRVPDTAKPGEEVTIRVSAFYEDGLPAPASEVKFSASSGTLSAPREVNPEEYPGYFQMTLSVPDTATGTLTVRQLTPAGGVEISIRIIPAEAAKKPIAFAVSVPDTAKPGEEVTIKVSASYGDGRPAPASEVKFSASSGTLSAPREVTPGNFEMILSVPDTATGTLTVSQILPVGNETFALAASIRIISATDDGGSTTAPDDPFRVPDVVVAHKPDDTGEIPDDGNTDPDPSNGTDSGGTNGPHGVTDDRRDTVGSRLEALGTLKANLDFRVKSLLERIFVTDRYGGRFDCDVTVDRDTGIITAIEWEGYDFTIEGQFRGTGQMYQSEVKEALEKRMIDTSRGKPMPTWDGQPSGTDTFEYGWHQRRKWH